MERLLRVLIFDKSKENLLVLLDEFSRGGFLPSFERVESIESLQKALTCQTWDILILDCDEGQSVLDIIKTGKEEIPMILLAGIENEEKAIKIMKAGASDYILKNNMKRLCPVVGRILRDTDRNISEQNKTLEMLMATQQQLQHVLQSSSSIVFSLKTGK